MNDPSSDKVHSCRTCTFAMLTAGKPSLPKASRHQRIVKLGRQLQFDGQFSMRQDGRMEPADKPQDVTSTGVSSSSNNVSEMASEVLQDGVFSPSATKPLRAALEGMKEAQKRFFDSHDNSTEFWKEALSKAESPEERERTQERFAEREKVAAKVAEGNNSTWIKGAVVGLAVVALVIGGPPAAAQVMKRLA